MIKVQSINPPKPDRIMSKRKVEKLMRTYDKQFKEQALKLSDEIGVGKAAEQLGIPYYTS